MKQWIVAFFLSVLTITYCGEVFAQTNTSLPPEIEVEDNSYFGNVERGKSLFDEESERLQDKVSVSIPLPKTLALGIDFIQDIRALSEKYFDILLIVSIFVFSLFQCILASYLRHRYPWLGLSTMGVGIILILHQFGSMNLLAIPLLVSICLLPALWQLFQLAHVDFAKTFFTNLGFLFVVYVGVILQSPSTVMLMYIIWGIYLFGLYFRVFSNIAFKSGRSSWIVFSTFIPIVGLCIYLLSCVRSIMKKELVNPKFINVILGLLKKGLNRIAIRQYALNAKVRLEYFDHHFVYATRLFQSGKEHMHSGLYKLKNALINVVLVVFITLAFGQILLTVLTIKEYYNGHAIEKQTAQFYKAITDDNTAMLHNLIEGGFEVNVSCTNQSIRTCSPLFQAVQHDAVRVLPILIDTGLVTDIVDENEVSLLEYAESVGSEQVVGILKGE